MAQDDPLDDRRQDALSRFSESRRQEAEVSEVISPPSHILERSAIYIGAALLVFVLVLLYIGRVDVVVTVRAQVVPESELIPVQSRNTGVLAEVRVDLGDEVEQDEVIARLAGANAAADLEALERSIALREAEALRSRQEVAATAELVQDFSLLADAAVDLALYGDLVDRVQTLRLAQQEVARLERLADTDMSRMRDVFTARIAALDRTIAVRHTNLERLRAELATLEEGVRLREEQLLGIEELIDAGLSTRARALDVRDGVLAARATLAAQYERIGMLDLDISEADLEVAELRQQLASEEDRRGDQLAAARRAEAGARSAVTAFLTERQARLRDLEADIARLRDELRFARQRAEALTIRAPVGGTLASLAYAAPGARVVEGEEIARIVPEGVPNILRAPLPGRDAGRVEVGQHAVVKFDAFPFYRFGTVHGEVTAVFPEPDGTGFIVRIALGRQTIGAEPDSDRIGAGLAATVEIVTEKRSLLELLFDKGAQIFTSDPVEPPRPDGPQDGAGALRPGT